MKATWPKVRLRSGDPWVVHKEQRIAKIMANIRGILAEHGA